MENKHLEANKQHWNERIDVHLNSDLYKMDRFINGEDSLVGPEMEELGDVQGKSLLHLQCHFGQDTLNWARLGAKSTGVDLSDKAIETAKKLNKQLNLNSDFICCNVYDLKDHLDKKYDIVFTSIGTIGWLPDLEKWAEIVNHFLKEGGCFYILDFHPFLWSLDDNFEKIHYNYFNKEVIKEITEGSYADKEANVRSESFSWNHPFSEIITSLKNQDLSLETF